MVHRSSLCSLVDALKEGIPWFYDFTWYVFQACDFNSYVAAYKPDEVNDLLMNSDYFFFAKIDYSGLHFMRHLHGDQN